MDVIKKILASKAFKEILRVLVALLAGYAGSGCGVLPAPNAPQLAVFECQLEVFESVIPRAAAEDLVMAARAENVEYLVRQLLRLGLDAPAIGKLADSYHACEASEAPEAQAPSGGPALLHI